jgi:hypothetical protein
MTRLVVALSALALVGACAKTASKDRDETADLSGLVVRTDRLVLRHGPLGMDGAHKGTYVLVDIENQAAVDRLVSANGDLLDVEGKVIGELGFDEVVIPAGKSRTFALASAQEHRNAAGATVHVRGAFPVDVKQPLAVGDVRLSDAPDGKLVTATILNRGQRTAIVNILASFHDSTGRILERPWQRRQVNAMSSVEIKFAAPASTAKADVYTGDAIY